MVAGLTRLGDNLGLCHTNRNWHDVGGRSVGRNLRPRSQCVAKVFQKVLDGHGCSPSVLSSQLESPHSDVLLKIHELLDSAAAFKQPFAALEDHSGLGRDLHLDAS